MYDTIELAEDKFLHHLIYFFVLSRNDIIVNKTSETEIAGGAMGDWERFLFPSNVYDHLFFPLFVVKSCKVYL